ncbi:MAG: hypothetical protein HY957_07575, partial [Nitrospirae bacterium]|nr:hypothetical protein [Nitrospirota bacterium]
TGRNDDTIYAYQGGDSVYAGLSNDTVYGNNGKDRLYGEDGNDILYGNNGDDKLYGGNGNDTLYGGNGYDLLHGGKGDDTIYTGRGKDTIILNSGDGHDTVKAGDRDRDECGWDADNDIVKFDVNPLDLIFSRSGDNLEVMINGGTDSITIEDWNWRDESGRGRRHERDDKEYLIDEFRSSNGKQLDDRKVEQLIQAMATFGADNGMSWSDAIQQKPQEVQTVLAQYWEKQ